MSTAQTEANPLYNFRAPKGLRRSDIEGGHFIADRASQVNDVGALNIYPGMFRYIPDPTLEIEIAIWEDSPDPRSKSNYYNMTVREGYNVMKADEWEILEESAAMIWQGDAAGRLAFGRNEGRLGEISMILMFRTAEAAEEAQARRARVAMEIDKSPEELQAQMADKYSSLNATVQVLDEEDDGTDDVQIKRSRKARTR